VLTAWHAFRLRRDGGIAVPPPQARSSQERISRYELVRRELAAVLFCAAALILLALFCPAPISSALGDIDTLSGDASAPWFFLWVQQMLKWGDPFLLGVLVPLLVLTALILIPYVLPQPVPEHLGRWFPPSSRLAQGVLAVILLLVLLFTLLALLPVA